MTRFCMNFWSWMSWSYQLEAGVGEDETWGGGKIAKGLGSGYP